MRELAAAPAARLPQPSSRDNRIQINRECTMLAFTKNAAAAIRDLTERREAPEGTGLRITTDAFTRRLKLSLAKQPHEGDEVLDAAGVRLFLDPETATLLADKALDAKEDDHGTIRFSVTDRSRITLRKVNL
jgi:Fe-S cluster assembly iron-binding protein IscA